jgi:hypothetical protein
MITYVIGDIFQSPARVLVNPVNTVGVMGHGLAYDFKLCFPAMFERYRDLCATGAFSVGQLMLYKTPHKWVLNFPLKRHWRAAARLEDIEVGLQNFAATYADRGITSASFPLLIGDGELDWARDVRPLMERYLNPLPIPVFVHLYDHDDPYINPERSIRAVRTWLENIPQPVSFSKFWRDLSRVLARDHKLMTLDGATSFTVGRDTRRKGRSLVIMIAGEPQPLFISESLLMELWAYVRGAGYALPINFPGGLDAHGLVVASLLAALEPVRPIHILGENGRRHIGVQVVPPATRDGVIRVELE